MLLLHFRSDFLERMFKPSERIYAEVFARADEGVEDSVVLGAPVVLAEQIVLAAKCGGALTLFDGIVVYKVMAVFGIPHDTGP